MAAQLMFGQLDVTGRGSIDLADLRRLCAMLGYDDTDGANEDFARAYLEAFDSDRAGWLDLQEFMVLYGMLADEFATRLVSGKKRLAADADEAARRTRNRRAAKADPRFYERQLEQQQQAAKAKTIERVRKLRGASAGASRDGGGSGVAGAGGAAGGANGVANGGSSGSGDGDEGGSPSATVAAAAASPSRQAGGTRAVAAVLQVRQEAAATAIQTAARGKLARREVSQRRQRVVAAATGGGLLRRFVVTARAVQTFVRGVMAGLIQAGMGRALHVGQQHLDELQRLREDEAAVVVQRGARGHLARRERDRRVQQQRQHQHQHQRHQQGEHQSEAQAAAASVQLVVVDVRGQKEAEQDNKQSATDDGKQDDDDNDEVRRRLQQQQQEEAAATTVQRAVRGSLGRREAAARRAAAAAEAAAAAAEASAEASAAAAVAIEEEEVRQELATMQMQDWYRQRAAARKMAALRREFEDGLPGGRGSGAGAADAADGAADGGGAGGTGTGRRSDSMEQYYALLRALTEAYVSTAGKEMRAAVQAALVVADVEVAKFGQGKIDALVHKTVGRVSAVLENKDRERAQGKTTSAAIKHQRKQVQCLTGRNAGGGWGRDGTGSLWCWCCAGAVWWYAVVVVGVALAMVCG